MASTHRTNASKSSCVRTLPLSVKSTGPAPGKDNWSINGRVEYVFPGTAFTEGKEVTVIWYDGGKSRPPQMRMGRAETMAQINVENLSKSYHVAVRDPGVAGAFRGLFHRRAYFDDEELPQAAE